MMRRAAVVVALTVAVLGHCAALRIPMELQPREIPNVLGTPTPPTDPVPLLFINALSPGHNATTPDGVERTATLELEDEDVGLTSVAYGSIAETEVILDQNYRLRLTTSPADDIVLQRVVGRALPDDATVIVMAYKDQSDFDVSGDVEMYVAPDAEAFSIVMNAQEPPVATRSEAVLYLMNGIVGLDTRVDAFLVDEDYFSWRVLHDLDPGYLQRFVVDANRKYRLKVVPTGTVNSIEEFDAAKSLIEEGELHFRVEAGGRYYGALYGWYREKVDIDPTEAALTFQRTGVRLVDVRPVFPIRLAVTPELVFSRYTGDPVATDTAAQQQ